MAPACALWSLESQFARVGNCRPDRHNAYQPGNEQFSTGQRLLCSRAKVNLQKVRNGFLSDRDFPSLTAAAGKLAESSLLIDDTAGLSISELRAKARRLKEGL